MTLNDWGGVPISTCIKKHNTIQMRYGYTLYSSSRTCGAHFTSCASHADARVGYEISGHNTHDTKDPEALLKLQTLINRQHATIVPYQLHQWSQPLAFVLLSGDRSFSPRLHETSVLQKYPHRTTSNPKNNAFNPACTPSPTPGPNLSPIESRLYIPFLETVGA